MITRYALFEGSIAEGQMAAFRAAILAEVAPLWRQFPGASEVKICFGAERDEGAPEFPLMLAISYPDRDAMAEALASPFRAESRVATEKVTSRFFTGRIHHHVTEATVY